MKILAIRGKNLASLASEFSVDFQAEPLVSAGLYAITGATGAGKSTLLDALCLALYERTPRLARAAAKGESIPDVGDNSLGPADPRTLLRRGSAEGYAEVDFVGSDGVSYRTRWSVRRARNRADGKLQNSEIALLRLSDQQALGDHRKTETLRLIEACIGLNFEQFTRAVLLAQNDFAAFLKAADDDRAELLQTLTGTQTFTQLSMQAFGRAKAENEELKRLQLQLADQAPLDADARAARETEYTTQDAKAAGIEQQKTLVEGYLRWHQQWTQLQGNEAEATARAGQAALAKSQAGERYQQLARIEALQPARPLCTEVERLQGEIASGAERLKVQAGLVAQANAVAGERKQQVVAATQALQQAEGTKAATQPRVDQAKALDAQIETLAPGHQAAVKARDEALRALQQEQVRQAGLQQELARVQKLKESGERWLAEHPHHQPLAEGWLRWETLLDQAAKLLRQGKKTAADAAQQAKAEGELGHSLEKAKTDQGGREREYQGAAASLAALAEALKVFNPDEMLRRKEGLEVRRDQLLGAGQLWRTLVEQGQGLLQLDKQKAAQEDALTQMEEAGQQLAAEKPGAESLLAQAEKSLRIAELAASESVERLRAQLEADSPCPVCGSARHPYAEHHPALAGVLEGLREEVACLRKRLTAILERSAALAARKKEGEKQLAQLNQERARLTAAGEGVRQQWAAHPLAVETAALAEAERSAWFAGQQETVKSQLEQASQEESRYREALRLRDAAQAGVTRAQAVLATAKAKQVEDELAYQKTAQAHQTARQKLDDIERQLQAALADLDAAFPAPNWHEAWRDAWRADPEAFGVRCRGEAEAWMRQQKEALELSQQIHGLNTAILAAAEAGALAVRHHDTQAAQCARLERDSQARQTERKALFEGQAVAEVEAQLNAAIESARSALARRQSESQAALAEEARLEEAVRQIQGQLERNQEAFLAARQALDAWLLAFNARLEASSLSLDELKDALAFEPAWILGERQALQALDHAVATAAAVLGEHRKTRQGHETARPTAESAETLRETLARTALDLGAAKEALATLRLELVRDDERRQKSRSLVAAIEPQAAKARVWSQLSDLIGSADGKKFRNFAQQLTLDILIGYANRHLESLSRRYRLERVRDSLGLLVVDQDMGDELRSVHSLSGGESFLVSLALALGLASLSSHRVRVESLFIDEGFGSLDADSLRIAMEALDKLQAQGRKVGVISHVQEMTERIGTRIEVRRLAGGRSRVVAG